MSLFLTSADGLMSYIVPVVVEEKVGSASLMGLILATSSMAGTLCDFLYAKVFDRKKSAFFGKFLFSLVFFFPLIFLVFTNVLSFVTAMVIWGVYFEAMIFSNFLFVHEHVPIARHAWAWGTLITMRNVGWVIGPFLAGRLHVMHPTFPFLGAIGFYSVALLLFLFLRLADPKRITKTTHHHVKHKARSFAKEIRVWFTYGHRIWHLLGLTLLLYLIDSAFFSIGPLFEEQLQKESKLGSFFISMYTIPGVFMGLLTGILAKPYGKKKAAFVGGMVGGVGLFLLSRVGEIQMVLFTAFIGAIGLAVLHPELEAVYEDFVARSKEAGSDIVGISALMGSIGYVIGPIVNGYLADRIGAQAVFGLWGILLTGYSIVLFFIVKRKIRLPQQAVHRILRKRL